jgi:hypothetical protein
MLRKLIAAVLAVLINCAVFVPLQTMDTVAIAQVAPSGARNVITLPAITVRPTRSELEMLHRSASPAAASIAGDVGSSATIDRE